MSKDRTYNSQWYTNDKRKEHCLSIAEDGEELFRTLTGAIQGTFNEDLSHIDCFWNGKEWALLLALRCRHITATLQLLTKL